MDKKFLLDHLDEIISDERVISLARGAGLKIIEIPDWMSLVPYFWRNAKDTEEFSLSVNSHFSAGSRITGHICGIRTTPPPKNGATQDKGGLVDKITDVHKIKNFSKNVYVTAGKLGFHQDLRSSTEESPIFFQRGSSFYEQHSLGITRNTHDWDREAMEALMKHENGQGKDEASLDYLARQGRGHPQLTLYVGPGKFTAGMNNCIVRYIGGIIEHWGKYLLPTIWENHKGDIHISEGYKVELNKKVIPLSGTNIPMDLIYEISVTPTFEVTSVNFAATVDSIITMGNNILRVAQDHYGRDCRYLRTASDK